MAAIQERVSKLISELFADIKRNAIATGHYDTGKTVASLEQRYRSEGDTHIFEVWANKYFMTLDTGSGPARKKGSDAERAEFLQNLAAWCQRKNFPTGGLSAEQYMRVAKWLKWYIGKRGSYLYRHHGEQNKVVAPAIDRFESELTHALTALFEGEITRAFTQKQ